MKGKQNNKGTQRKPNNRGSKGKAYWKDKERKDAKRGNYQDAFADDEKSKSGKFPIDTKSTDNDPSWYNAQPNLIRDVASLSFGKMTGYPSEMYPDSIVSRSGDFQLYREPTLPVPGIMAYYFTPTIGNANNPTDAINVAGMALFSFLRSSNSRTGEYEMPDLMMTIVAIDSAYMWYSSLCRVYGLLSNVSVWNKYTPSALIEAMGFDYVSISQRIADFRSLINQFAYRLSALVMPTDISYITRHVWMCENVYTDTETTKAQYYFYMPDQLYIYNETSSTGTQLTLRPLMNSGSVTGDINGVWTYLFNLDDIANICDEILNPLIGSEDVSYMCADMLRAFGNNTFRVSPIAETYSVTPVYNPEVLSQMENASIYYHGDDYASAAYAAGPYTTWVEGTIDQKPGVNEGYIVSNLNLVVQPWSGDTTSNGTMPIVANLEDAITLINMHKDSPTPDDVMVATRLTHRLYPKSDDISAPWSQFSGSKSYFSNSLKITNPFMHKVQNVGTEIITRAKVINLARYVRGGYPVARVFATFQQNSLFTFLNNVGTGGNIIKTSTLSDWEYMRSIISSFDWHTIFYPIYMNMKDFTAGSSSPATYMLGAPQFEMDNFTQLEWERLQNMHDVAVLSQFAVRSMGNYTLK